MMEHASTLFVGTLTTLLAIVNPLEALPIFLRLMEGKDDREHLQVARRSCCYATLLLFFFLLFGTAMLKVFEVPPSMGRIVGFFVSAIGMGLIFHGFLEVMQQYGAIAKP
jgi:multiple antibiotic resistance protein